MKKKVKARWTAKEIKVEPGGLHGVNVSILLRVHNLAELGFKYALKRRGEEYALLASIPIERYMAMSAEEKRREYEKEVEGILTELTEVENRHRKAEELGKTISQEVLTGEMSFPQMQERTPLKIVDEELVQKAVEEAKKLVYDSPELRKMLPFRELLTVAGNYGLDEKWLTTVGYLIIEEIALRQWLVQHDHDKQDVKKIRAYYKLLELVEQDFENMGKTLNAREVGKFLGEREFRNRVLHLGYKPTPDDAKETKEMAIGLLEFLKQH